MSELRIAAKHVAAEMRGTPGNTPHRHGHQEMLGSEEVVLPACGSPATRRLSPRLEQVECGPSFDAADLNNDGVIDRDEFEAFQASQKSDAASGESRGTRLMGHSRGDWVGTPEEACAVRLMNTLVEGDETKAIRNLEVALAEQPPGERPYFLPGVIRLLEEDESPNPNPNPTSS